MRRSNHNGSNGAEQFTPRVLPVRIKYEPLKGCELDTRLLETMSEYSSYVQKYTGNKPTLGEIVSAGLEEIFKSDKGFIKWQEEQPRSEEVHNLAPATRNAHPVKVMVD